MASTRYIFLVGAARSGTKFLRDALATSDGVAAIPYDVNYVWRHGNESCPHDELTADDISDKTASHIRKSLNRLATKHHAGPAEVILEKTVSNTLRMDMIRRVFPEAEFLYLERSGLDVVESAYRQWTMPADRSYLFEKLRYFPIREWRYAFWFAKNMLGSSESIPVWGPRYAGIDVDLSQHGVAETCALQWKFSVERARIGVDSADTVSVQYEQLDHRESGLANVLSTLKIPCPEQVLGKFEERFQKTTSWPGKLPATDLEAVEKIVSSVPTFLTD